MKRIFLTFILLSICIVAHAAGPALPARVGGAVTIDGKLLTDASGRELVISVTTKDGKDFTPPAKDIDGLNGAGKYIVDIPTYDSVNQPGGAKPESTAIIRAFKNGKELKVISPQNGEFVIGKGGSITIIDLVLSMQP
jgi:hypothetical protein